MKNAKEPSLHFTPSRVEGWPDVTEIAVYPQRLEVLSAGQWRTFRFVDMVDWWPPKWLWKWVFRRGSRFFTPAVAGRYWCHPNESQYFTFYTKPELVVYMPADGPKEYGESHFVKIKQVLHAGGFGSDDLA